MGFNNNGAENLVKNFVEQGIEFKKNRKNICLGINFGKSKITDLSQAKDDYLTSLKLLIPYCDYAAINVSSPNTEGLRKLQDPILLKELIKEIQNLPNCPPLFVKIAPDLSFKDIEITNNKKVKMVPIKDICSSPTPKIINGFARIQPNK